MGWLGPVLPQLERNVTPWLDTESFYSRPRHASGTPVPREELRTGNAFLPRELFEQVRFDPAFGLSGGEDLDLFSRLRASGVRFSWCDEAVVTELVPAERHRLVWLSSRAFRGGVVHTRIARRAGRCSVTAAVLPRALAGLAAFTLALPAATLRGRPFGARVWLRLCTQAGHLWACAGGTYDAYAPRNVNLASRT